MQDSIALSDTPIHAGLTASTSPKRWSALGRFGFRLAFCYLLISIITVTDIVNLLPLLGSKLASWIYSFWTWQAQWAAQHVFHLQGIAALPHSANSRDTALDWIRLGLIVLAAILFSVVWTIVDRRRPNYQTAAVWLRFFLRLSLVLLMLRYGLMKIFPLQMSPPSLAVLNEPLGNTSPMTLLWTLIGMNPVYEILCGVIETTAALLLFFRKTATLGALLTGFVMINVLLFNLFFDVPVKLGAANLLLYALAVLAPDLHSLYGYFWRHQPATLSKLWAPLFKSRLLRIGTKSLEIGFLVLALYYFIPGMSQLAAQSRASLHHPSPLTGEWLVDSTIFESGSHHIDRPVLTGEGRPLNALFLEPDGRVTARSSDGRLWRAQAVVDFSKRTFFLASPYFDGERFNAQYTFQQPDPMHLVLMPTDKYAATNGIVSLTRVPLPATYPLLERDFHWINEWPFER